MTSKPLIIYHANCADGFTAAWVAARALGDVQLCPAQYGDSPPVEEARGRDVYVLDFSYDLEGTHALADRARSIHVLDHHKSAAKSLGLQQHEAPPYWTTLRLSNGEAYFDMSRSGARIAWDWFHPGEDPPALVRYVEDRDLWRWKLPGSDVVNAAVLSFIHTLPTWDVLADRLEQELEQVALEGAAILRYQEQLIERIAANAHTVVIDGHEVPAVNSPVLQSELGHRLAQGHDFAAVYFDTADKGVVSLRSRESGYDVSEIAQRQGGGGHPGAAGFPRALFWTEERDE